MRGPLALAATAVVPFALLADQAAGQRAPAPRSPPAVVHYGTIADAGLGVDASLHGDIPFPADNPWNTDMSDPRRYPVDPNSKAIIAHIGAGTSLHADFGPPPYGIPYVVVGAGQPLVDVRIPSDGGYPRESDKGPFPIPVDAPVEGGATGYAQGGDAHVLVLSRSPVPGRATQLFEMWRAKEDGDHGWTAAAVAAFDVRSDVVRPAFDGRCGVTSADAAGLPIFPGLVRYDEVESGAIRHAIRFTAESTRAAFVPPATHWASSLNHANFPPMGARLRLKASYVIPADFSAQTKVILEAMKKYGLILADNGSNWYISGTEDPRWGDTRVIEELRQVKGRNFEVIDMRGLRSTCP